MEFVNKQGITCIPKKKTRGRPTDRFLTDSMLCAIHNWIGRGLKDRGSMIEGTLIISMEREKASELPYYGADRLFCHSGAETPYEAAPPA
jgi:hypothetical protein